MVAVVARTRRPPTTSEWTVERRMRARRVAKLGMCDLGLGRGHRQAPTELGQVCRTCRIRHISIAKLEVASRILCKLGMDDW
jgi:hypothetical protein